MSAAEITGPGPTASDVAAAKLACLKKFGHDRLIGIDFCSPADGQLLVTVLLADLSFAEASAHVDARSVSILSARTALLESRVLYPASEVLEELRAEWGAFDARIEDTYRTEVGFVAGGARARVLTAQTAPLGLAPALVETMLREADGARLWSVYRPENGLACVLRQPMAPIHGLAWEMVREAVRARRGMICAPLTIISDHCVWTPDGALRAHMERRPGRAEDLTDPFLEMGGQAAKTSARRF